jgi:hypothetical protein
MVSNNNTDNVREFNKHIHDIFKLVSGFKGFNNSLFTKIRTLLREFEDIDEGMLIEKLWPFVWANKEYITTGDIKHFLDKNYDMIVTKASRETKILSYDECIRMVKKLKIAFPKNEDKYVTFINHTRSMLRLVAQYNLNKKSQ